MARLWQRAGAQLIFSLRFPCIKVSDTVQPRTVTVAVPVATIEPPQQNWYCPVCALNNTTLPACESSCRHTVKTFTANEQLAVLPAASVAVQVTDAVPTGNIEPEGGTHATITPGQSSEAVGVV